MKIACWISLLLIAVCLLFSHVCNAYSSTSLTVKQPSVLLHRYMAQRDTTTESLDTNDDIDNNKKKVSFFKRRLQTQPSVAVVTPSLNSKDQLVPSAASIAQLGLLNNGKYDDEELGYQSNPDFKSGFVAIIGNPNMGKSTLMNAVLKQKLSIVSPKPQTTRHKIFGILTEDNQYQIVFTDTPGMLQPNYELQETMAGAVREAASDADVVVLVTDVYGEELHDAKIMNR